MLFIRCATVCKQLYIEINHYMACKRTSHPSFSQNRFGMMKPQLSLRMAQDARDSDII